MYGNHLGRAGRVSTCRLGQFETAVVDGLAVTPADMYRLMRDGTPITPQNNAAMYYDMQPSNDFEVGAIYRRGVDMADLYQIEQSTKKKMSKAFKTMSHETDSN